jgi:hypothetical protein
MELCLFDRGGLVAHRSRYAFWRRLAPLKLKAPIAPQARTCGPRVIIFYLCVSIKLQDNHWL